MLENPTEVQHQQMLTCMRVMNSTASPTVNLPSATPCRGTLDEDHLSCLHDMDSADYSGMSSMYAPVDTAV